MNINLAILFTLTAAFLFASWYQSLKHLGDYPLAGFIFWLYISSFITISIALLILGPKDMPGGIWMLLTGKRMLALGIMLGGFSLAIGMAISLSHMKENGMVANMAIMGTVSSITGLVLTFVIGGLSPDASLTIVLISSVVLIFASVVTQYASALKNKEITQKVSVLDENRTLDVIDTLNEMSEKQRKVFYLKQNLWLLTSNILTMGYSVAYMIGTKSQLHPNGFPALLCVFLLATGSLVGAMVYAGYNLTKNRAWSKALRPENRKPIYMAILSGICHYGGNLLTIYSLPLLSAPVSNLLTRTSTIWTYFWGIAYGEFRGSSMKSKIILYIGILIFIVGTALLTFGLY